MHQDLPSYLDISVLTIRPKLLFDVQYQRQNNGIGFSSRRGRFVVAGRSAYEVMVGLAPYLTGKISVEEICRQLNPLHLDMAVELIKTLHDYGCLVDRSMEATDLGEDIQQRFAAQIEFIGQFADSPLARFERFRKSRILVSGSGFAAESVIAAFARNGLESLLCDRQSVEPEGIRQLLVDCRSSNPQFRLEAVDGQAVLQCGSSGKKLDVCCYAADKTDPQAVANMFHASRAHEIPFIPALFLTGKGFVGPLSNGVSGPCWFCLLMRRCDRMAAEQSLLLWRAVALNRPLDDQGPEALGNASAIIGNLVAFETFKFLAGHLSTEIEDAVLMFDLESLESRKCALLPHPMCPHCASFSSVADREYLLAASNIEDTIPSSAIRKMRQASIMVDADVGLIARFDDGDLSQSHIFQSAAIVGDMPVSSSSPEFGYSLRSYGDAKLSAMGAVVRRCCARQVDRRRIWVGSAGEARREGHRVVLPSSILRSLLTRDELADAGFQWIYALSLTRREICLVPAAAVYSRSPLNVGIFERTDAGIGVGHSFEEACGDAICSRTAYLCLAALAAGELTAVTLPLTSLRRDSADLELALATCEQLEIPYRVLGVRYCGVSVVIAFCAGIGFDEKNVAVGAGRQTADSAVAALVDLLGIVKGARVNRPLSYYLPNGLGYRLDVLEIEGRSRGLDLDVAKKMDGAAEILIANMSNYDIQSAGFTVVKAVMACVSDESQTA